ncbi:hypothetical protein [Amedibacillus dolichus]|uniref:Lipoprotein n=1 Tax=Amedibacillus dolichus DSM 3991 TaxID=428127 RepID=A8RFP9_9FIRM|nr:hypothetical protein [Amedibacillus dolichus]EDP10297.1 hypothetical protein EUBDOL_02312 [Amedibacillus dolichus DSM 3991]
MKIQKIMLFLLITSTSLFGCQKSTEKVDSTPMNVDNADTNIDRYKIAQKNNLSIKNFSLINKFSSYTNENGIQIKMNYNVEGANSEKVKTENSYSLLNESGQSIMDTNYWYNGNYELVDDGDIRQKKETKPETINKEIQTMLSSSFVSLDNINENMIQKNSDRYNIKLTIDNKGIIEKILESIEATTDDSNKMIIEKVNKFNISYVIKDNYIIEENIVFDVISEGNRIKGNNLVKFNPICPKLNFPKNIDKFEEVRD